MDSLQERRVWQRVSADRNQPPQDPSRGLPALITQSQVNATAYLQLCRRLSSRHSALLRQMYQQEQTQIACLRGLYTLITGSQPEICCVTAESGTPEQVLRRCYGNKMKLLAQYEQRQADPEYGKIFLRLALQTQDHCRRLLELLGSL